MPSIQNSELLGAVAEALYERIAGGPGGADEIELRLRVHAWVNECEGRDGELWETELGPLLARLERRMLGDWTRKCEP
jgi:hypothetical protein